MITIERRDAPIGPPRVLLTRDPEGCGAWAAQLAERGIDAVSLPCLQHSVTRDGLLIHRFVAAVRGSGPGDWLVFTSRRGVESAVVLLQAADLMPPPGVGIAAVGQATESACRATFGRCDLVPPVDSAHGTGLAASLLEFSAATALCCLAREGQTDLEDTLRPAGWTVDRFDLYATVPAAPHAGEETLEVDAVFLASPSAVSSLLHRARVHPDVPLLAIGPTTARALKDAGRPPSGVAKSPGLGPLIQLLFELLPELQPSLETTS